MFRRSGGAHGPFGLSTPLADLVPEDPLHRTRSLPELVAEIVGTEEGKRRFDSRPQRDCNRDYLSRDEIGLGLQPFNLSRASFHDPNMPKIRLCRLLVPSVLKT